MSHASSNVIDEWRKGIHEGGFMDAAGNEWFIPFSQSHRTLRECYAELDAIGYQQEEVPLIIRPKDEAFVLGCTRGATKRLTDLEEKLYGIFTRFFYPREYRFTEEDLQVYKDAVRLGYISDCRPLDKVDYSLYLDGDLAFIRSALGLEKNLLTAYFEIEKSRYPESIESQRLLN